MDASEQSTDVVTSPIKVFLMTSKNNRFQQRYMKIVNKYMLFLECPEPAAGSPAAKTPKSPDVKAVSHDMRFLRVCSIDSETEK